MSRYLLVNDIINRAALECGLLPSGDPVSDTNDSFVQMVGLLNSSGQELCELNDWPVLIKRDGIEQTGFLLLALFLLKAGLGLKGAI